MPALRASEPDALHDALARGETALAEAEKILKQAEAALAASRNAVPSSSSSSWFIALRFSGRFSTTCLTGPRSSVTTMLIGDS